MADMSTGYSVEGDGFAVLTPRLVWGEHVDDAVVCGTCRALAAGGRGWPVTRADTGRRVKVKRSDNDIVFLL